MPLPYFSSWLLVPDRVAEAQLSQLVLSVDLCAPRHALDRVLQRIALHRALAGGFDLPRTTHDDAPSPTDA